MRSDIGRLFFWLDKLSHSKCIHPLTKDEISNHKDPKVVNTLKVKLDSYNVLKTTAPDTDEIAKIRKSDDKTANDRNDTTLLNELVSERVDVFITEDRNIHKKARKLNISHLVFTIDAYLEKVVAENPDLVSYNTLSVEKMHFGDVNVDDNFFDSFRKDYPGFNDWFNRKSDEMVYCCKEEDSIIAFLYLKREREEENYSDIAPPLPPKKRLKIGTFKVAANGFRLGERFIKIIFDNALKFEVEEIYLTIFDHGENQLRLLNLLRDWGFRSHGTKKSQVGCEQVLTRSSRPNCTLDTNDPRCYYPYAKQKSTKWIVPIYPEYHTDLFPDSQLNRESVDGLDSKRPHGNALSKVYISQSWERSLNPGDIIVFYRTSSKGHAWYTSVTTTLGVVQKVETSIQDKEHFIKLCRKRSVFTNDELVAQWDYNENNRPFVVNFLYLYFFPKRMNLETLVQKEVIKNAPRGFVKLTDDQFNTILRGSNVARDIIID